ncbi:MAG: DUF4268 domain-containing protein [Crocinitomicaceae bacterium]|jgi:hypothetical protein|nr:DUF4268 domain-containing protein [Crocinitomicaceae bacterium]MBT5402393.1 DUF4268 domain-containing protein [Crocinitomicaceae bacterium]MBT6030353.1 DUF4268 domain-containing protein [Crocinitomicaceae bacterium]
MFSKEERRERKSLFWISFGKFMTSKHRSASGKKVNWSNYKTGVNDIYFRLDCDNKQAIISIEFQHKDAGIRELFLEQFLQLKTVFHAQVNEEWEWDSLACTETGQQIIRVSKTRNGVNIFNKNDWLEVFTFFEPRLLAIDSFWCEFGELFLILSK